MTRRRTADPIHIGGILKGVLKTYRRQADGDLVRIYDLWDDTVGATVARNAQPAAFKGSLLIVHVYSSAWAQQLRFLEADLIEKVNAALGAALVDRMRFKVGPL